MVLATKKFVLIRAANGSFNVWWLSGGTRVTNVAASMTGTTALTGSTWAAGAAMNGQMAPATAMLTGNTTAAQRVLAPTAPTVTVNVVGTGITVSVKVTRNVATVAQNNTWWRQPAMTTAVGLQRGDLVFIAGTRADWALHAKVILIEKTPVMTPTTVRPPTPTAPRHVHDRRHHRNRGQPQLSSSPRVTRPPGGNRPAARAMPLCAAWHGRSASPEEKHPEEEDEARGMAAGAAGHTARTWNHYGHRARSR